MFTHFFTNRHQDLQAIISKNSLNDYSQITMNQIHSNNVTVITEKPDQNILINDTDSILTKLPNTILIVKTADCLPILISHPSGIIGAIHAGRKGTEQKIMLKTLEKIYEIWGVKSNLKIYFGPRICHKCYQINKETDLHYDLELENKKQIAKYLQTNLHQIVDAKQCTACQNDQYFSYRKEGKGVKMNFGGIGIK